MLFAPHVVKGAVHPLFKASPSGEASGFQGGFWPMAALFQGSFKPGYQNTISGNSRLPFASDSRNMIMYIGR